MRRSSIVAVAAVAALAVGGTAADAAVKKGKFSGKTGESDALGFKVNAKHKVAHFYFEDVTLHCSDSTSLNTPSGSDRIQLDGLRFKISKSRRFKISVHSDAGTKIKARGRFNKKGRKAKGTLRVSARFDSQTGRQDPHGDVICKSHDLEWVANRQ
jgi:hypothetical protein